MPNIGEKKNLIGRKLKKPNKTPKKPPGWFFLKKNPGFCQTWLDAQDVAEAVPEGRGELVPLVRRDDCWHAIPRDPTLNLNTSTPVRSITMNMYVVPSEAGSGPTKSTWICDNRWAGTAMCWGRTCTWRALCPSDISYIQPPTLSRLLPGRAIHTWN
jgi:hypothetical protein